MNRCLDHYRRLWNQTEPDLLQGFIEHVHEAIARAIKQKLPSATPAGGYLTEHAGSAMQFDAVLAEAGVHFAELGFEISWCQGFTYIQGSLTKLGNVNFVISGWAE